MTARHSARQERVIDAVGRRAARAGAARRLPSVARNLGQIGILGWQIVLPGLLGLALGRWIDHRLTSGIFWTAGLLVGGLALGCWSAWRWIERQ